MTTKTDEIMALAETAQTRRLACDIPTGDLYKRIANDAYAAAHAALRAAVEALEADNERLRANGAKVIAGLCDRCLLKLQATK